MGIVPCHSAATGVLFAWIYGRDLDWDLIAASIYDKYSIGPSNRSIFTRCFTMTNMIQVCGNLVDSEYLS